MKTLLLSIIVIMLGSVFTGTYIGLAQVAPVTAFQIASFKGNHGTYTIQYDIVNATVVGTPLDLAAKALFFEINATGDGQLVVQLPRAIIDSKNGSQDVPYFVSVYNIRSLGGPTKIMPEEADGNETRMLKINFPKGTTEIEIVGTFFVEKFRYAAPASIPTLSPLGQYVSGLSAKNVHCKDGLQLIIKIEDGSPACVKSDTAKILSERGWKMTSTTEIVPNVYSPSTNTSPSAENLTYITPIVPKTYDVRGTVSWALPNIPLMKIASTTTGLQIARGGGLDSYDHNSVRLELYYGKTSDSNIIIASTVVNMKKMPVHIYGINIQGRITYTNDTRSIALQSTPEIIPKEDAILGQGESQTKYIIGNWTVTGKPVNVFSVTTDYSYDDIENYNGMTNGYQMFIPVQQIP